MKRCSQCKSSPRSDGGPKFVRDGLNKHVQVRCGCGRHTAWHATKLAAQKEWERHGGKVQKTCRVGKFTLRRDKDFWIIRRKGDLNVVTNCMEVDALEQCYTTEESVALNRAARRIVLLETLK